jgi:hypothetical protein
MAIRKTPESYVLRSIMDYLAVKRIFAMRMNSGSVQDRRGVPVRMHEPGTADILALPRNKVPHFIECKAPNGKQSELQKSFQERVESEGFKYILAYGIDDVEKVI